VSDALARMIRYDARNVAEVFTSPKNWRPVHYFAVVTHCALRFIEAEDTAPELVGAARDNLRGAVQGYKRVMDGLRDGEVSE
jgi:hypothetical protein